MSRHTLAINNKTAKGLDMKNILLTTTALTLAIASMNSWANEQTDWPNSMTVGTASQGGTYYIYGSGWANLVNQKLDTRIGAEITGGPVQNISMVQMGEHDFGMVTMGPAVDALEGNSELLPDNTHADVRAMFPMYQTALHIVSLESSDIESVADLDGKRVGVGPAGGTNDEYHPRLFEALGYDVETLQGGASDQAGQLQDNLIDAFAFGAGMPIASFSQLKAQADVNIFSYSEEEIEQILEEFPALSHSVVPGGTYNSVDEDIPTVSLWNFAITHKDMPDTLVYEIVDTIMSNHEQMLQVHGAAAETLPENISYNNSIPFHPGAVKWFEENGYDIPEDLKG